MSKDLLTGICEFYDRSIIMIDDMLKGVERIQATINENNSRINSMINESIMSLQIYNNFRTYYVLGRGAAQTFQINTIEGVLR